MTYSAIDGILKLLNKDGCDVSNFSCVLHNTDALLDMV